jgi:hypothetical protein
MKNGFPAPNKEPATNQNYHLTGKAPYRFESGFLQRGVSDELPTEAAAPSTPQVEVICQPRR